MGLLTRVSDIVTANLNAILDRVENPERMLAQIIREMEEALAVAKQHAVSVVASERRLARELERQQDAAARWRARATLALEKNREDLARRALTKEFDSADVARSLDTRVAAARRQCAEVQAMVHALADRLEQARRQEWLLQARRQADAIHAESLAALGAGNVRSPFARFSRLQSRIEDQEDNLHLDVASALDPVEDELNRMETAARVDLALAALRAERASTSP